MERISAKTVTDALALAMEHADEMGAVVVLYTTPKESRSQWGMFVNEGQTLESLNFLIDVVKCWIFD